MVFARYGSNAAFEGAQFSAHNFSGLQQRLDDPFQRRVTLGQGLHARGVAARRRRPDLQSEAAQNPRRLISTS